MGDLVSPPSVEAVQVSASKRLVDEPFSTRASSSFCAYVHISKPIRSKAKKAADLQRTRKNASSDQRAYTVDRRRRAWIGRCCYTARLRWSLLGIHAHEHGVAQHGQCPQA